MENFNYMNEILKSLEYAATVPFAIQNLNIQQNQMQSRPFQESVPAPAQAMHQMNDDDDFFENSSLTSQLQNIQLDDTLPIPAAATIKSQSNLRKKEFKELEEKCNRLSAMMREISLNSNRKPLYSRGNAQYSSFPAWTYSLNDQRPKQAVKRPTNTYRIQDTGEHEPIHFPQAPLIDMPRGINPIYTLNHGSVVCAVAFSNPTKHVFTGGKGYIKIWDISKPSIEPVDQLHCLQGNSHIRSIKLLKDQQTLVVGGEAKNLTIWDITGPKIRIKGLLPSLAQACYNFAVSDDSRIGFSCGSNGNVAIYDLQSNVLVRELEGHTDGVTSIGICSNGTKIWTGSLDNTVKSWDLRLGKQIQQFDFQSQIYSLDFNNNWLTVGLKNSNIEAINVLNNEKYLLRLHKNSVLGLKVAKNGNWFISAGNDNLLNVSKSPCGPNILQLKQTSAILSCDISTDDKYIVTGSGDNNALVYEVVY